MVSRRERTIVVFDTNVFVRGLKSRSVGSPNKRLVRLWLFRLLQLVVCDELIAEYLDTFRDVVGLNDRLLEIWRQRWIDYPPTTVVNLGRRYTESRDPDDNLLLATARAGRAEYLITNDCDLLDLPADFQKTLPFKIITPAAFLKVFGQ